MVRAITSRRYCRGDTDNELERCEDHERGKIFDEPPERKGSNQQNYCIVVISNVRLIPGHREARTHLQITLFRWYTSLVCNK